MEHVITINIQDDMKKQIDEISKIKNKTVNDLITESIAKFIKVERFNRIRETVVPYAEKQSIYTDEDVFEQIS